MLEQSVSVFVNVQHSIIAVSQCAVWSHTNPPSIKTKLPYIQQESAGDNYKDFSDHYSAW